MIDYLLMTNQIKDLHSSAHVAGMAGKNTQRGTVGTIFGLDPAGPLFAVNAPNDRLASGDALYVEAIHTNGRFNGIGGETFVFKFEYFWQLNSTCSTNCRC